MPTIKDVAEVSGYSVCTVSKALSGKGNIREDTRRKILAAVEEIGYHPNRLAVSLKTGRTNSLALIVPDVTNIYFPRLEKYVEQYASQKGYMVFLCDAGNSFEREKNFIEELSRGRVDGVIVTPSTPEHDHIMRLKELGIPYVYLNRYFQDDPDRCIRIDNERGAFECVSYLLDKGYRRIGAVLQSFRNTSYRERYEGMKRAFAQHGMQLDEDLIVFDADDLENSHHAIGALLKKKNRPEAVFATNDMLALSVYQAAYDEGLRLPEDLAVVGYDDSILAGKIVPRLTSYYQPARECAKAAIDRIMAAIEGAPAPENEILCGRLVVRDSAPGKTEQRARVI